MRSLSAVIFGVPAWPLVDLSSFCTVALFPDVFVTSPVPGGMLCPLPDYVSDLTRFQAWGFVRVCPKGGFRLGYDGVLLLPPGLPDLLKCCVLDVKIFACMLVTRKVELAC